MNHKVTSNPFTAADREPKKIMLLVCCIIPEQVILQKFNIIYKFQLTSTVLYLRALEKKWHYI